MGRKNAREGAMKLLYQMDMRENYSNELLNLYLENNEYDQKETEYINEAIDAVKDVIEMIDKHIEENTHGWTINRLARVDLSILRIAVYEILYRKDIPIEVSINEAIEIAKKYSSEDAYRFINGVLGGVVKAKKDNADGK